MSSSDRFERILRWNLISGSPLTSFRWGSISPVSSRRRGRVPASQQGFAPLSRSNHRPVPTVLAGSRTRRLVAWQQLAAIAVIYLCYLGSRELAGLGTGRALDNARSIVSLENQMGLSVERGIQRWFLRHDWLVSIADGVYLAAHWPLIAVTAIWLFRRVPDGFRLLRNAMFASGMVAFVIFAAFPVSPPRFSLGGVRDTVVERSSTLHDLLQPASLMNEVAAMPSIHFGWNFLVCLAIARYARSSRIRLAALMIPVLMAVAVIATANHYVLDVVAGAVLCAGAWATMEIWSPRSGGAGFT